MIRTLHSRLRHAALATRHEANSLMEVIRLFARLRNGHCVFRQSGMGGMNLLVRADEDLGRGLYFFREYEPRDSSFILRNLRPTDICVDVGANVGYYTILLGAKVREGKMHAFEPAELNFHVLAVNALTNQLSNVVVNNCAVGDRNEDVDFFVAQDGAFSSTVDTGRQRIIEKTRVRMVTLDSYCREVGISRVDFLKVDVEGGERQVIRGAHELLSDHARKPRLVMLELYEPMLRKFGAGIPDVVSLMKRYNYAPSVCVADELVPFTEQHYDTFFNVFFTEA